MQLQAQFECRLVNWIECQSPIESVLGDIEFRHDPLARLAADLHAALAAAGFALEPRPFAAHVTLLRKARAPRSLPLLPPLAWPVDAFTLVASSLSAGGSRYEQLKAFELPSGRNIDGSLPGGRP